MRNNRVNKLLLERWQDRVASISRSTFTLNETAESKE